MMRPIVTRRTMIGRTTPRGFSLVELLLTLALSVALMSLIGSAIMFYATQLETRNTQVRHVQLAHAVLNLLSDDLRAAIQPPEFDDSALSSLLGSASGGGQAAPGEGQDLSAAGLDDNSVPEEEMMEEEPTTSAQSADLSSGTMLSRRPGLIGNQTQIQFEVSRLPRLEEYQQLIMPGSGNQLLDVPSDIKTISYFVQGAGGSVQDPLASTAAGAAFASDNLGNNQSGGLVRRSLDRAVTAFAMNNSGGATMASTGDLIAPEVSSMTFRYWDGLMWQLFWDSDEMGCLPMAVEVTLTMIQRPLDSSDTTVELPTTEYVQIIRLPMGRMVQQESTEDLSSAGL